MVHKTNCFYIYFRSNFIKKTKQKTNIPTTGLIILPVYYCIDLDLAAFVLSTNIQDFKH